MQVYNELDDILFGVLKLYERKEFPELGVIRPTFHATNKTLDFFIEVASSLDSFLDFSLQPSSVGVDDGGGIHVFSRNSERELTVVFPGNPNNSPYVFHEVVSGHPEDIYAIEEDITVDALLNWLKWVAKVD